MQTSIDEFRQVTDELQTSVDELQTSVDESQTSLDEVSTNQRVFFIVASYYTFTCAFYWRIFFFFAKGKEIKLLT